MNYLKKSLILFFVLTVVHSYAQDTTALLKELNKMMSFSVQPYVYYTTVTKTTATPVLQPEDSMSVQGEFYKNETNVYMGSSKQEIYLEDSFYIEINHDRKSIWISKVNTETKKKMNLMPLDDKMMQELFRKNFSVSKTVLNNESGRLNFFSKENYDSTTTIVSNIGIQYSAKKYMPELLEMDVQMKQQLSEEMLQQLKQQGIDTKQLVQTVNGISYLVRRQKMTMLFSTIDNSREKAMQIPSWKSKLDYNGVTNGFTAKAGFYSDYEITITY